MSAGYILTLGLGGSQGTTGYIITVGLFSGAAVEPEPEAPAVTGGWLRQDEISSLRRMHRDVDVVEVEEVTTYGLPPAVLPSAWLDTPTSHARPAEGLSAARSPRPDSTIQRLQAQYQEALARQQRQAEAQYAQLADAYEALQAAYEELLFYVELQEMR